MIKFIIIGALISILILSLWRKISGFSVRTRNHQISTSPEIIEVSAPLAIYKKAVNQTLITVGTGVLLLLLCIILATKFKIALIVLPLSFYLIAQFFVVSNHIKTCRNQQVLFNRNTNDLTVKYADGRTTRNLNLNTDIKKIKEVKAVQKNRGLLLGYYQLKTSSDSVYIPYLIGLNEQTQPFFSKLDLFNREIETKLFPII